MRSPQTYIESLALGEVVDLILINPSRMVHPMHIHGSRFWVLASGNLDDADAAVTGPDGGVDETKLDLDGPPLRDTHAVPQATGGNDGMSGGGASDGGMGGGGAGSMSGGSGMAGGGAEVKPLSYGYSVLRFVALYPGMWPFHCHTALHAESGMAMVFQVGEGDGRSPSSDDGRLGSSEPPPDPRFWVLPGGAITCGLQEGGAGGGGGSADKGLPRWGAMLMVVMGIALAVAVLAGIGAYYQRRRIKWLEGRGILKCNDDDEAAASQEHQSLLSVVLGGADGTATCAHHHHHHSNKAAPGGPMEDTHGSCCGDEAGAMEAGRPHRSSGDVMLTQTFWSRDASGGSGGSGGGTPQSPLWQP